MRIAIDMDGTICYCEEWWMYHKAKPLHGAIETVNKLYGEGHEITIFTARHEEDRKVTEEWLNAYGVKYHKLVLDKPLVDVYIDDKAIAHINWEETSKCLKAKAIAIAPEKS